MDVSMSIILSVTAFFSNIAEIAILLKRGKQRSRPEDVLLSLSVSDVLVGVGFLSTTVVRMSRKSLTPDTNFVFNTASSIFLAFSICVSIFHILVIAVERVYAVRFPLKYRVNMTRKLTRRVIIGIWLFTMLVLSMLTMPIYLHWSFIRLKRYTGFMILVAGFVITVAYGYLTHLLRQRYRVVTRQHLATGNDPSRNVERNWNSLLAVVLAVVYVLLSFPAAIFWVTGIVPGVTQAEWLIILNSALNPFFYFWKSYLSRREERKRDALNRVSNQRERTQEHTQ